jgi:hypothetical protein
MVNPSLAMALMEKEDFSHLYPEIAALRKKAIAILKEAERRQESAVKVIAISPDYDRRFEI